MLAGDICYERGTAERATAWLESLAARGALVLVGDPGRAYLPRAKLAELAIYQVPTTRDLEDMEIKRSGVFRLIGAEITGEGGIFRHPEASRYLAQAQTPRW